MSATLSENKPVERSGGESKSSEVLEIDQLIKHPLNHSWTFWFLECDRNKSWLENLKKVVSFSTVEDFWSLYNHIKSVSELKAGCDYSLFKDGIEPMWEDPANKQGGRWLVSIEKKQRDLDLDECWLEMMLCMIGEAFDEDGDEVNGATVNLRRGVGRIGLWLTSGNVSKSEVILSIGRKIKDRLNLGRQPIHYQLHSDTQSKNSSNTKSMFTV